MILSAKYGYIEPDFRISGNYNVTFKDLQTNPVSINTLIDQIREKGLAEYPVIYGLGGREYRDLISKSFAVFGRKIEFPFQGKGRIGEIMSLIKKTTAECR
jgi:hypothetical protein